MSLALALAFGSFSFAAYLIFVGQSIVVVHRGSAVTNFGAAAIGLVGAYVFYDIWPGIPWPVALVVALAASMALGVAMHLLVMRRLRKASIATKVVATLALMFLITSLADQYLAPNGEIRTVPSLLPTTSLTIFGQSLQEGQLYALLIAIAVTGVLVVTQTRTRFGLATMAVCENQNVVAGMGWSPDRIASMNWALGSALAAVGTILFAPVSGLQPDELAILVVPALGAALIGRFDSPWLCLVGALAIGIGEAMVGLVTTTPGWAEAAPLIIIVGILALRGEGTLDRSEVAAHLPLVGRTPSRKTMLFCFLVGLVLMFVLPLPWLTAVSTSLIFAIVFLSTVVLTGYAGQLSLAQVGLAGVAAFMMTVFADRFGFPLWAAMVLGVVVTVPIGMVVAIPAFRARGATLAIATLSLVVVIEDLLLTNPLATSFYGTGVLKPLEVFGLKLDDIGHPRAYSVFALIVIALMVLTVRNIRHSSLGRRLLAMRANPRAAAALGISPPMMKAYAFAVAAAIAGVFGVLLEAQLSYAGFGTFSTTTSITSVLQGTIGGLGFQSGAFLGAQGAPGGVGAKLLSLITGPSQWLIIITATLTFVVILQAPDGIAEMQIRQFKSQIRWLRRKLGRVADTSPAQGRDPFAMAIRAGDILTRVRRGGRVEVEGLTVKFGGVTALDNVSLVINPGEIVGLIGPNGAGKTTFIDAVCGFQASQGIVRLDGKEISKQSAVKRARHGLARSFQSLELFEEMSVGENLLAASERRERTDWLRALVWPKRPETTDNAAAAVEQFSLEPYIHLEPRHLPYGKRRLVAIARTFASNPAIVFLDEPAAGLDAAERSELGTMLRRIASERNLGVLLVEHDVDLVLRTCDRVVALVTGRVIASGSPEEVRRDPLVVEAYLGQVDTAVMDRDRVAIEAPVALSTAEKAHG